MIGSNVYDAVCKQKVVILSNNRWNVFFEVIFKFLEILYRYLLYLRLNKCLKYGQNLLQVMRECLQKYRWEGFTLTLPISHPDFHIFPNLKW